MPYRNGVELVFHHMGIPTTVARPGERYSPMFGMSTVDAECASLRVQWHRFDADSTLHPLLRTVPHPAFKVADLDRAAAGAPLLLGPYEPIPGFRVVIIEDGGVPVELIQTTLTDDEIWARKESGSILYQQIPAGE